MNYDKREMSEYDKKHLRRLRALGVCGLPAVEERPKCLACGKRLEPNVETHWTKPDESGKHPTPDGYPAPVRRTFEGYKGYGHMTDGGMFCRLSCVVRYARACVRAGHRLSAVKQPRAS